ncbi:MAG: histidine ABC transporter permease, partial [Aestuariibacter sp.]|nr:histidine ABC transporter permease [Aestuariibacter sp.]
MESIWNYRGLLFDGALVTVQLALGALLFSILLGLIGAMAKLSHNRLSQKLAGAYTTL